MPGASLGRPPLARRRIRRRVVESAAARLLSRLEHVLGLRVVRRGSAHRRRRGGVVVAARRGMLARRWERLPSRHGWRHERAQGRSRRRVVMVYRGAGGRREARRGRVELGLRGRPEAEGRVSRRPLRRWGATRRRHDRGARRVQYVARMPSLSVVVVTGMLKHR